MEEVKFPAAIPPAIPPPMLAISLSRVRNEWVAKEGQATGIPLPASILGFLE